MWYDKYKEERFLIQQQGDHNKFWSAFYDENTNKVHMRWGRLGTKGQSQTKEFDTSYKAIHFIDSKFREKRRKGYTDKHNGETIDRSIFDQLAAEAAIIGTQNKCESMRWVEVKDDTVEQIEEDRLQNPDCNPGLLVHIKTRTLIDGSNSTFLLFTSDGCHKLVRNKIANTKQNNNTYTKRIPLTDPNLLNRIEQLIERNTINSPTRSRKL